MVILIHGDDVASSRKKLNEVLSDKKSISRFDAKQADVESILTSFESQELFSTERTIVIEQLFSFKAKKDVLIPVLKTKVDTITVILWQNEILDKRILTPLKGFEIHTFSLPKHFYTFLDTFVPHHAKELHTSLFSLTQQFSVEQVFYALIKRLRMLIMLKSGKPEEFDELRAMQPWQLSKLSQQARLWNLSHLLNVYKQLFDLEFRMKTSNLPLPLLNHIDIVLLQEV